MKLTIRQAALDDIASSVTWLSREHLDIANAFLTAIEAEFVLLAAHPFLGRKRFFEVRSIRSWRVRGFEKHLIFYRITSASLDIIRVLHGARDVRTML